MDAPARVLFVKERMAWPRASGHDVHTFGMMRGLAGLGHSVAMATIAASPAEALAGSEASATYCYEDGFPAAEERQHYPLRLSKFQEKFRNYWGVEADPIAWVAACAADFRADAVVVSGLNVLPYLGALPTQTVKVWYAADEWLWHHGSQISLLQPGTWKEAKPGFIKWLYERAYRSLVDRVWVVTPPDARAFRWLVQPQAVDIMPNGIDADWYQPGDEPVTPRTCTFWGRLDFGPNIQALEWFCDKIWPRVRQHVPEARFEIYGFQPGPEIERLTALPGVTLTANLPDLRPTIRRAGVVVLPFVSGGGIKNKLLEAAALGMPIVATPRVREGLVGSPPFPMTWSVRQWVEELTRLWSQAELRLQQGQANRDWVVTHHTWGAAARVASAGLTQSLQSRTPTPAGNPTVVGTE